jgi:RNA polymerase sigma-70 factor (ECF subfamily)
MLDDQALKAWFCREVLPLEPMLTRFIRRHCRSPHEVADIRQEVYEKLLTAAARALPIQASAYVFTIVRNVMINRAKRANVISIELVATLEDVVPDADWLTPDRHVDGRQELHRVEAGLERLPPRCREVIWLRKVEGLSTREVAERLGVGIDAVEQQTMLGMRALTDFMLGGEGRIKRPPRAASRNKGKLS